MQKSLLTLVFSIIFFMSCEDKSTGINKVPDHIWPMEVGNYWVFEAATLNGDSLLRKDTVEFRVWEKVKISGEDWYIMSSTGKDKNTVYINKSDGLWVDSYTQGQTEYSSNNHLFLKYPANIGDEILWEDFSTKTVEKDVLIKTHAGDFKCIHYIFYTDGGLDLYFCPGVGMVSEKFITMIDSSKEKIDTIWIDIKLLEYLVK